MVYMGAGVHRRGMVEPIHHQDCGGVGSLNIRKLRLWYMLLAVFIALAMTLVEVLVCFFCVDEPKEDETTVPAVAVLPVLYDTENVNSGVFDICGYCACCTPYADINRDENGRVLTASGQWVEIGQCVAVDTDIIPLGSIVTIDGQAYTALDTGVKGYVIDILMSHEDAHSAGVRTELVTWRTA